MNPYSRFWLERYRRLRHQPTPPIHWGVFLVLALMWTPLPLVDPACFVFFTIPLWILFFEQLLRSKAYYRRWPSSR